jgi:hypothetical protein
MKTEDRYIYKRHGKYQISRTINKKTYSYGVYNSIIEARRVRDELVSNNWDESYCNVKRKGIRDNKVNDMLYISHGRSGDYFIQKSNGSSVEIFSIQTNDLEWLKKERDWMVECEWDWDRIVEQDYDEYCFLGQPLKKEG